MNPVTAADKTKLFVKDRGSDRRKFPTDFFRTFFGVVTVKNPVSEELLVWARSISMQASLEASLEYLKSFSNTDFRSDLAAVEVPKLIIHRTADRLSWTLSHSVGGVVSGGPQATCAAC